MAKRDRAKTFAYVDPKRVKNEKQEKMKNYSMRSCNHNFKCHLLTVFAATNLQSPR